MVYMAGFVVVEGIDGCGKSSVASRVARGLGKRAVLTREPTDTWMGKAVREGEGRETSPYVDALLFMADRAQHTEKIASWLAKGKLVVCDRYYHSTVAYQAANLKDVFEGDPFKWLLEANLRISIHPDLTVLLVIPPKLSLERIRGRTSYSRFERLEFLREVHRNYLRLARSDRSIVKIDATKDLDTVVESVIGLIRKRKL
ncbi:MAG: dTMP kinase [Candidatus Thermoplasmatota archaeon]|nr:dTMP kinase [Candidatus Thermoplasmatota archaeon]